jgi:hypothetical protein
MIFESKLEEGDKIFLFSHFSYDYEVLPFTIIDGADFIIRPSEQDLYNINDRDKPYRYALPLLNLSIGIPHVCIRISSKHSKQDELFGDIILALRLLRPLNIGISGSFSYHKEQPCADPALNPLITMINTSSLHKGLVSNDCYTSDDFKAIAKLLKKIRGFRKKFRRLKTALNSFGHVTIGVSKSYSMMYQELFACLGMLFGSEHKAKNLGNHAARFLKSKKIGEWVEFNYCKKRNNVVHGNPEFWIPQQRFSSFVSMKKQEDLFNLHEIVRWSLLGFIGMKYRELDGYNEKCLNKLRDNTLSKIFASPMFLKNQAMKLLK